MLTIVAFIVLIGILILVHEAGHFFAAKAVGVQGLRFSLGFGPPLLRMKRGETEYWLCAVIQIGGWGFCSGCGKSEVSGTLKSLPS